MYDVAKFIPSVKANQENSPVNTESEESLQIFRQSQCLSPMGQLMIERFANDHS